MANVREKFRRVMIEGDISEGIPVIEWATWWDKTLDAWHSQGLPTDADPMDWFGLDRHRQLWISPRGPECPGPRGHGEGIMIDDDDYQAIRPHLYPKPRFNEAKMKAMRAEQENGETLLWITLEGPFWFPRTLFGIEAHLYAFYDHPKLMERINADLADYSLAVIDEVCRYFVPDFMTFAEDMSYNHGPMISYGLMDRCMAPFYRRVVPDLLKRGIITLIDSDGDIEPLVPWFIDVGLQGILPLERMAGVDVARLRAKYPKWRMIGGFDKTVMHRGEDALIAEFQRINSAVAGGYYIPSVDHQTPPNVTIEDYKLYIKLLKELSESISKQ